jgi:mono/diheme cytochrome c family protein
MMKALTIGLAVALAASIALNIAVRRGPITVAPLEYFPDMARTARYNAFEANPNFPDGMTLRTPPNGTIPRGMLPPGSDPATPEGGDPVNPFTPADTAAVARGDAMFGAYCVPCHGTTGEGDGLVVQRGFPAPPSLVSGRASTMSDTEIFDVISFGSGTMPSYAAQMERDDRWKAVLHLRALQTTPPAAAPASPTPTTPPPGDAR